MKKIIYIIIILILLGLAFFAGIKYNQAQYLDTCLDLGGGQNPGNYPICVIKK